MSLRHSILARLSIFMAVDRHNFASQKLRDCGIFLHQWAWQDDLCPKDVYINQLLRCRPVIMVEGIVDANPWIISTPHKRVSNGKEGMHRECETGHVICANIYMIITAQSWIVSGYLAIQWLNVAFCFAEARKEAWPTTEGLDRCRGDQTM